VSKVLVVHDGKRERELLLVERLVVGRDPACDISVDDVLLSRRHAEFVAAASAVTVRDLGSRNGVFVNGTRRAEQALKLGDVVQIGPLRVRYLRDRPVTPGAPSPADADGTRMIPGPPPPVSAAAPGPAAAPISAPSPTPFPASLDAFRAPAPSLEDDDIDEMDGETRFASGGAFAEAVKGAAPPDNEATGFTPAPRPVAPLSVGTPTPRESPAVQSASTRPLALGSFVLIQLGALAAIVFVSTVAPLILSRGTVLDAIDGGSVTALLIWPILPLVIGLAATLVIANIVNRRVLNAIGSHRQSAEGR